MSRARTSGQPLASWGERLTDVWLAELRAEARSNQGVAGLRFVGRGWVTRGKGYWAGRALAVLFFSVVTYLFAALPVLGVASGAARLPLWAGLVLLLGPAAWVAVCVATLQQLKRHGFVQTGSPGNAPFGPLKMTALVMLLIVCIPGLVLGGLLATLRRDFPGEQQARDVREAWLDS